MVDRPLEAAGMLVRARRGWAPSRVAIALCAAALATVVPAPGRAEAGPDLIRRARVLPPDHVRIETVEPITNLDPSNFRFTEQRAPDVAIEVIEVRAEPGNRIMLRVVERLDAARAYRVEVVDPEGAKDVAPPPWAMFLTVILSAALINNFVFTRYLGLCIFFGVSKKRDTALGMGFTFLMVMVITAMLSWALYFFVLKPLALRFLEILVFIGVVAFLVQALDTILKKTHRALHQRFGIYLMLITTNCIILAVPLLNAAADAGPSESFALALGSGAGFALALFLMSCAREKMELARIPAAFQGLPIAFALAGMFALAFMGFSGLSFFR